MDIEKLKSLPIGQIIDVKAMRGGDVNQAFRIDTLEKSYFLLLQANRDAAFYAAEKRGLELFTEGGITAPKVIASGELDGDAYLLLEYLEESYEGNHSELGKLVAKLHQIIQTEGKFGFEFAYQGSSIKFENSWKDSWKELFLKARMEPLKQRLVDTNLWREEDIRAYKEVQNIIEESLDKHESEPSLLHGDLWSGNFMFVDSGKPVLFDPSPLYGDREFDIGISTVFSGFQESFYKAYQTQLPLKEGYEKRLKFYRLYLLMIHLDKFGNTYYQSVKNELNEIINDANS